MRKHVRQWTVVLALILAGDAAIHAQQPRSVAPRQRSAPIQNRQLPQLEVDLGQPAPLASRGRLPKPNPAPVVNPPVESKPVAQEEPVLPVQTSSALELAPVTWRQDFESTQRRPIETAVFGKGPHRIAVISNLSGNSDSTVAVVEQLAGLFARQELMPVNLSVLIVRNPNPDGTASRTLTNSRGVDLNRNFPTTRFTANPSRGTGDRPGSEAETRALMQLLNQFNPERVIHVVESRSIRGTVRSDDILPHELLPNYDAAPYDGVYKSGSLSGYVHQTLKRSIVEVELPQESTPALDEESLVQLAVTVLDQTARNVKSRFAPRNDVAVNSSKTMKASQSHSDGLRGNVEFLPPPPGSGPMPPAQERFIELPPPPGM
jgi:hypothetical protein